VNALQDQFVTEARELIRQATDDLIGLEQDGISPERIDRVFRAFHTLKGSAGMVELPAMSNTLHAAEDLLAAIKQGALDVSADIVDQALACLDQVSRWVDDFESGGALTAQAGEDGRAMADRLRSFLLNIQNQQPESSMRGSVPNGGNTALPNWASRWIAAQRDKLVSRNPTPSADIFAISYEPNADCFFNGDDPLQLMRQVQDLLVFHVEPREDFPPLSSLNPYACNLRIQAISAGSYDDIAKIFRLVPDQVWITRLPPDALSVTQSALNEGGDALVRKVIETQAELLRFPNRNDDFAGCVGSATRSASNALRYSQHEHLSDTVERAGVLSLSDRDVGPLLAALEQALATIDRAPPTALAEDVDGSPIAPTASIERPADRMLRVSEAKIEALVNLAGELVVAKNALAHSAKRLERELGGHEVGAFIRRDRDAIDRLVVELHGTILQLRMVPAGQVFQSFPRLVRDVSRQLGKKVALVTQGDGTEADKTVVDRLFEPLVHLVRNAVDHGIETPEQRLAAGKPETATVSIQASRVGDRFLLQVADDGRGIDPAVVRRKAFEKQLMPSEELEALTDGQVIELVFAVGFSTTTEVTDISGRGVGMDVVRTAVEQLGGRVSVKSKTGVGTTVQIDLPTTIAMSRIMVVEAAGQFFGIPMDAVSETVRITPDRISQIKNNSGFVFRDRVVPIVALAELMKIPERPKDVTAAKLLVVMEVSSSIAALEIDAIGDRLDVVLKPMQGLLAGARGYAGTTLLGNGQVLLVLDIKELLP
jgi:two-component system chemotaxis sensor kinase CheA